MLKVPDLSYANDWIICEWQRYAGHLDAKTVLQRLAAIRYFEAVTGGKRFDLLKREDFQEVRDDLKRRADVNAGDSLSASEIRHRIAHIVSFFNWLKTQEGYRRLPPDFEGHLRVPKSVTAAAAQTKTKSFMSLEEAESLLLAMPNASLADRRSRAIFAIAFLAALRADTIASLRLGHVLIDENIIVQDGKVSRTKNGKSLRIFWFPIADAFSVEFCRWVAQLRKFGFHDEDALFPDLKYLGYRHLGSAVRLDIVPVPKTSSAVTKAFKLACRDHDIDYNPHSAKHTIAAERDKRRLTKEQRRAWSRNMGHETEQITETHYAKLSNEEWIQVMKKIGFEQPEATASGYTREQMHNALDAVLDTLDIGQVRAENSSKSA